MSCANSGISGEGAYVLSVDRSFGLASGSPSRSFSGRFLPYLLFGITIVAVFLAFDDTIGVSSQMVDDAV